MFNGITKALRTIYDDCSGNRLQTKHTFTVYECNRAVDFDGCRYSVKPHSDSYGVIIEFVDCIARYYSGLYRYVDVVISYRHTNIGQQIYDGFEGGLNDSYTVYVDVKCTMKNEHCSAQSFKQWIEHGGYNNVSVL